MKFLRYIALAAVMAFAGVISATNAANGTWTPLAGVNPVNGAYVYGISTTLASFTTPPLPMRYTNSRVYMSIVPVSGTAITGQIYSTVGLPIGVSTSVTGNAANILPAASIGSGGSMTLVTPANTYHDVGANITNTAGQLINIRVLEIR